MNYEETIEYLYNSTPVFQQIGAAAYKPGLDNTLALDAMAGHPHRSFRTVHVGGTNGKGSTSHLLAAIFQCAGYRVGLYTSPHLVDFRERIRIDGEMIPQKEVVDFVEKYRSRFEEIHPSFFELTMMLAFDYFARKKVDIAIVEVGLGGRLDSTNIIEPELSVITNISLDHVQFLGDTLPQIAFEKAGIIKQEVPVVIGESDGEVRRVFVDKARATNSAIRFADDEAPLKETRLWQGKLFGQSVFGEKIEGVLGGKCQIANAHTVLLAVDELRKRGFDLTQNAVEDGFAKVIELTGLRGRWEVICRSPFTVCDTGHNEAGIRQVVEQLSSLPFEKLHIVFGMVNDKDVTHVLELLPKDASYYFTQASVSRALAAESIARKAEMFGLRGIIIPDVRTAYQTAFKAAGANDAIYIGGSSFIVADLLTELERTH